MYANAERQRIVSTRWRSSSTQLPHFIIVIATSFPRYVIPSSYRHTVVKLSGSATSVTPRSVAPTSTI
jgi:hypothetical protein